MIWHCSLWKPLPLTGPSTLRQRQKSTLKFSLPMTHWAHMEITTNCSLSFPPEKSLFSVTYCDWEWMMVNELVGGRVRNTWGTDRQTGSTALWELGGRWAVCSISELTPSTQDAAPSPGAGAVARWPFKLVRFLWRLYGENRFWQAHARLWPLWVCTARGSRST